MKLPILCGLFICSVLLSASGRNPEQARSVLLLTRYSGGIDFVDPGTLQVLGTLRTGAMTEWAKAGRNGTTLLVTQARPAEPRICCALYALDLETREMHELAYPAMRGILSPDGGTLFAGGARIDMRTLVREALPPLPRGYPVAVSSNGRWIFGFSSSAYEKNEWSVEIFDLMSNAAAQPLRIPGGQSVVGAAIGDEFYALGYGKRMATLWSVTPQTKELPPGRGVDLHELGGECRVARGKATLPLFLHDPVTGGGRLFVYEGSGGKLDRRECAHVPSGGVYVIDPESGAVTYLAPELYFLIGGLAVNCEGTELYGIELGPKIGGRPARLVRLDARTGKILAARDLGNGDATSVALATILESLIPRGEAPVTESATLPWASCPLTKTVMGEPPKDPHASPVGFGRWYVNEHRTIWVAPQDWRAGVGAKVYWSRPAGARLEITGKRIDGPAPALRVSDPSDYPGSVFEVTGMTFPAAGCWEVTAKGGGDELRFVTWVAPPPRRTPLAR